MNKKMIFSTAICLGLVFVMQQNCSAQTNTVNAKEQTQISQNDEKMFLENESKYNFTETVEKLTAEIVNKTWKVSAVHDLQETLKKSGTEVLPIKVFALCHPKHSSKILSKDDERIVSSLMPCRVSVYEKSDGKTYISRMNSGVLAKSFGGIIEEVMIASTNDVEEMLSSFIVAK